MSLHQSIINKTKAAKLANHQKAEELKNKKREELKPVIDKLVTDIEAALNIGAESGDSVCYIVYNYSNYSLEENKIIQEAIFQKFSEFMITLRYVSGAMASEYVKKPDYFVFNENKDEIAAADNSSYVLYTFDWSKYV